MKPRIEPVVWSPPARDTSQREQAPIALTNLQIFELPANGEDVAIDAQGRLLAGCEDGSVVRIDPRDGRRELLLNTGGRPVGIEVDRDGSLVVCDARRGVLRILPEERQMSTLVDARELGLKFCNNAAIASDGTIYFSDSSRRFDMDHWRGEILEHSGTGRLFARHPDGRVELLLDGLQFANGVALAADESFVAVAETGAYRIARRWLKGKKSGRSDLLIDRLPGFPDNLSSDPLGRIWVALPTPRNALLDALHRRHPLLRKLVWSLPESLQPQPERVVSVVAIDASGAIVDRVFGSTPSFHMVTGVRTHGQALYLASLELPRLAALTR